MSWSAIIHCRSSSTADVSLVEKGAYIGKCLLMCGLEQYVYADAIVSSLGTEPTTKPKLLLFLDEPTSVLDSQSAWAIVSFLRTLADTGQATLCA